MRTSEPAWRHLVLCALLASGSAGAQATATAEPAQPFRLSLGSFESTSAKFSAPDLLKVTRQALEALAAEQTPPTFSIVREIGGAADLTLTASVKAITGPKYQITFSLFTTDSTHLNSLMVQKVTKPRIGPIAAKSMVKNIVDHATQLMAKRDDSLKVAASSAVENAPDPEIPDGDGVVDAEEEPDPFFRPSVRGFLQALATAESIDDRALLHGIVGLQSTPRAFVQANLQPQLKTRGDHVSVNADLSLYGSTAVPNGLLLINELYADVQFGPVRLLAGRRRIVWGSGLAANPTDIFNPRKDPILLDLQRTGSLLLPMVDVTVGPFIFSGAITFPVDTNAWSLPKGIQPQNAIYALRGYVLFEGTDLNLMYYRDQNIGQHLVGFSGSRFFGDWVELHAEALFRGGPAQLPLVPQLDACSTPIDGSGNAITATALFGTRVHFEDQGILVGEYLYSGDGLDSNRYDQMKAHAGCIESTLALLGGPKAPAPPAHPVGFPSDTLFLVRDHHFFLNYERPHLTKGLLEDVSVMGGVVLSPVDFSAIFQAGVGYSFAGRATLGIRVMYWAGKNDSEIGAWPARVRGLANLRVIF